MAFRSMGLVRATLYTATGLALLFGGMHGASAQSSATGNATARVVQAIAIANTGDLAFGAFVPGASGGTVVVGTDGSRNATGTIQLLTSSSFPVSAGSFNVTGAANLTFSISLPTSTTLTRQSGSETMSVASFLSNPTSTGTLDSGGALGLKVAATLTVGSNQAAGQYSGTYSVTVSYN